MKNEQKSWDSQLPRIIEKFPWGQVFTTHEIGDYWIVEYYPRIYVDGQGTRKFHEYTEFHPYYQGRDMSQSFSSLDEAMIGAVVWKHEGGSSRAVQYIFRMIGIPKV